MSRIIIQTENLALIKLIKEAAKLAGEKVVLQKIDDKKSKFASELRAERDELLRQHKNKTLKTYENMSK